MNNKMAGFKEQYSWSYIAKVLDPHKTAGSQKQVQILTILSPSVRLIGDSLLTRVLLTISISYFSVIQLLNNMSV